MCADTSVRIAGRVCTHKQFLFLGLHRVLRRQNGGRARDENKTLGQAGRVKRGLPAAGENYQTSPFSPDSCLKGEKDVKSLGESQQILSFPGPRKRPSVASFLVREKSPSALGEVWQPVPVLGGGSYANTIRGPLPLGSSGKLPHESGR